MEGLDVARNALDEWTFDGALIELVRELFLNSLNSFDHEIK